jgi:GNAT superfamily N-acetyltransferase
MLYTEVMKPKKGQFKFNGPPQISHKTITYDNKNYTQISADKFGKHVGDMNLYPKNKQTNTREVNNLYVDKAHRNKGVAKAMWSYAKKNGLNPAHSTYQTPSGKAWAKKVGD